MFNDELAALVYKQKALLLMFPLDFDDDVDDKPTMPVIAHDALWSSTTMRQIPLFQADIHLS